ncbi:uncharacterized protein LOC106156569 isoform X1 [Lingula anatina]|uniref:Uncharacterized protein LOC106156569 isoform X1 n=1 Tax=Lingula anatina TaxID=7574 RepID=A0A1S3HMN8_LINAN|nr:uncharacterized protein LOC106156569 isoform X1 [Lingula anatina]|eukprot:XP_013387333.1 uncharacterized protein LOC106156569 isoform X1 [Lingula anatina]
MNRHEETSKHKHKRRKTGAERDRIRTRLQAKRSKANEHKRHTDCIDPLLHAKNERSTTGALTQNRLTNRLGLFAHGKKSGKIHRGPIYTPATTKAKADADLMKILDIADAELQKPLTLTCLRKSYKPQISVESVRIPVSESDSSSSDEVFIQRRSKENTSPICQVSFSKSIPIDEIKSLAKQLKPSRCYHGRNLLQEVKADLNKLLKQNAPPSPAAVISNSPAVWASSQSSQVSSTKGVNKDASLLVTSKNDQHTQLFSRSLPGQNIDSANNTLKKDLSFPIDGALDIDNGESQEKDALTLLIESEERRQARDSIKHNGKTDVILTESQEKDANIFIIENNEFHERKLAQDIARYYGKPDFATSSTNVNQSLDTSNPGFMRDQTKAYHPIVQQTWHVPSQVSQNAAVVTQINPAALQPVHQRAFTASSHLEQSWKTEHLQQCDRLYNPLPESLDILDYVDVKDPSTMDISAYHDLIVEGTWRTPTKRRRFNILKNAEDLFLKAGSSVDSPSPEQEFYRRKMF